MSEYWKSTPKYWCKFCKTFIRDTALEKKNHDSTPKHQSSIQRSLRELHKGTEREAREKQRAKDEVARLNGLVAAKPGASTSSSSSAGIPPSNSIAPPSSAPRHLTADERKRNIEQLAAMGVAVPQEYRKDLSIASEWSTVSETPIYRNRVKKQEDDSDDDSKPAVGSFGVRKRKLDEEEEELEAATTARKDWGSKFKSYPGSKGGDDDLDALLSGAITQKKSEAVPDVKTEHLESNDFPAGLKKEESIDATVSLAAVPDDNEPSTSTKQEDDTAVAPVVFKKRKGKR